MRVFNIPYDFLIFCFTTLVILGACLWIFFINLPILEALDDRGIEVRAEITALSDPYIVAQRGNYSRYGWRVDMSYRYQTQTGEWIADENTLVKQRARKLEVGQDFKVIYLPDRPEIHDSGLGNGYGGVGMIYALLMLAAVCAGMTVFHWVRLPRDWEGPQLWPPISNQ
ncbi:MAG: DUF3592 domain-containing protein [Pseudomonadota bacterium]